jgi:hypothetical protein
MIDRKLIKKILDDTIKEEYGSFNKICPSCYHREGHALIYCYLCGSKMEKFNPKIHVLTNKQWVSNAVNLKDKRLRTRLVVSNRYNWNVLRPGFFEELCKEFLRIVEEE